MTSKGRWNDEDGREGENIPMAGRGRREEEEDGGKVHIERKNQDDNKLQETIAAGLELEKRKPADYVDSVKKLTIGLNEIEKNPQIGRQAEVKERMKTILDEYKQSFKFKEFKDNNSRTPLHWGCILGNEFTVSLFLDEGADPNGQDKWLNTPLHYATYFCPGVILMLLERGANIWIPNEEYETPLQRIPPDTLEKYLNGCIQEKGRGYDYNAELDFTFLMPPEKAKKSKDVERSRDEEPVFAETTGLWWMTKSPKHHRVLKHPIITAFLDLKWQKISKVYKLHCCAYMLHLVVLYVFLDAGAFPSMQDARKSMTRGSNMECPCDNSFASSGDDNVTKEVFLDRKTYFPFMSTGWTVMRFVVVFLNSFILLLEIFQLLLNPFRYLMNLMNILKVAMVASTYVFLFVDDMDWGCWSGVLTLFFSLSEVIRIGSQLPFFSIYVHTFTTIAAKFLILIFWSWSVLVIMYSSVFMFLFYTADEFTSFLSSLSKTIVMLIGEFGYENIPFERYWGLSHLTFLTFVVFVTVILMNVMGLAVGETQNIKEKAEALQYVSQVKLIFYVESIFLQDPEYIFHVFNIWTCAKKWRRESMLKRRSRFRFPSLVNIFPCFNPILRFLAMKLMLLQADDGWHPTLPVHPMMDLVKELDIPGEISSSLGSASEQTRTTRRTHVIQMDTDAPKSNSRASRRESESRETSLKALSLCHREAENLICFLNEARKQNY
ncbi:unnamed protein product [Darwinula stevensoni]|uniref:Ion transport domain-containing protein n=1 Tax=Darwinula stevensoni TaxID=69355 RepID=A0A7R8X6A4_9CRUS|nr:unnamed protein product [Darwinula stevensoni]CAG0886678.1 unnamed protein product [Darwinula stevensoni]